MSNYLQCDADGCGHREPTPDYGPHLIGKPCPVCGANLLTQEDFDGYEPYRRVMDALVEAGLATYDEDDSEPGKVEMEIGHHGGKTSVTFGQPTRANPTGETA